MKRKYKVVVSAVSVLFLVTSMIACGEKKKDTAGDTSANTNPNDPNNPDNPDNPDNPANTAVAGTIAISLSAEGINNIVEGAALNLAGVEDETYGYPGIGMNYGEAIVEGFKIKLMSISLQTQSETGGWGQSVQLVDFGAEGKELEISEGFNGKVEATENVSIPAGNYTQVGVQSENAFSLKAYAYLDRDNDGVIDATVWTTATKIEIDTTQKLSPGSMPGYDYYRYPWLVATTAKSLTDNSSNPALNTTNLPEPIVVTDDGIAPKEAGAAAEKALSINLLIDTFRIIKVWDGRFQAGGTWVAGSNDATTIPPPVFPFPQGLNDSRILSDGLKTYDFYPQDKPAFALGNYLSIFAMVNRTGIKAQNYIVSKTADITPYNTQIMTVVMDGDGTPFFAKLGLGESNDTLHIGPMARAFSKQADGSYNFGTAYSMNDADGKFDGGLFYSDDLTKAGHLFESFRKLAVGQRGQMTMKNGPRCKGEYDYCVDAAGVAAYYLRAQ